MTKYGQFYNRKQTYCFRVWSAFLDTNGDVFSSTHSICNYNLVQWWRRQRQQIMNSRSFNRDYYSFKVFPRFWLAKRTRLIHHNQSLLTKLGRILCLARKWRQKCRELRVNTPLTEKTWGRGWVVLVVYLKNGGHFTRFRSNNYAKK